MSFADILKNPSQLTNNNIGGLKITDWLDSKEESVWFKAIDDDSKNFVLYVYGDKGKRDKGRTKIHGLISSNHGKVPVGKEEQELFWIIGNYRVMMSHRQKSFFANSKTRPKKIEGYEILTMLGNGYKGITFKVRKGVTEYALKIVNAEEYSDETYLSEFARVNKLAEIDRDHFLKIDDYGHCVLEVGSIPFLVEN